MSQSQTGGVKPFSIGGRLVRDRERLFGMTDEERAWRAQYLKDQVLSPREPVHVPEYERELLNPIRRFYRFPLDALGRALVPVLGQDRATKFRYLFGKACIITAGILGTHYYFKYHTNDWTRRGGWRVLRSRIAVLPGEPGYPEANFKDIKEFGDKGFKNSPI